MSLLVGWGYAQPEDIAHGDDGSLDWRLDIGSLKGKGLSGYLESVYQVRGAKHARLAGLVAAFAEKWDKQLADLQFVMDNFTRDLAKHAMLILPVASAGLGAGIGYRASITQGTKTAGTVDVSNPSALSRHLETLSV